MLILHRTVREREKKKRGERAGGGGAGAGVTLTSSRKDWAELYGCIE